MTLHSVVSLLILSWSDTEAHSLFSDTAVTTIVSKDGFKEAYREETRLSRLFGGEDMGKNTLNDKSISMNGGMNQIPSGEETEFG